MREAPRPFPKGKTVGISDPLGSFPSLADDAVVFVAHRSDQLRRATWASDFVVRAFVIRVGVEYFIGVIAALRKVVAVWLSAVLNQQDVAHVGPWAEDVMPIRYEYIVLHD